jgi:ATP-dependent DNA helicase RecG
LEVLEQYRRALPKARIEEYHGRLANEQQQIVMEKFLKGNIDLLVATSIIEVGLDVPNATVMLVEQSDWFGLAQLHQLRGRIGRGSKPGTCILIYQDKETVLPERLEAFCRLSDGFALAELDLRLRGPGDLLGELQSGWNRLRLADPTDTVLATRARTLAQAIERTQPESLLAWLALYDKGEGGETQP